MVWAATAVMNVGSSLIGGAIQADSSRYAANQQADAARAANETQRYVFDTQNEQQKPYREAGYNALSQIKNLLDDPNRITNDPGYEFGLREGAKQINRGALASGSFSGATLKALERYGQDYAGTKLNESYNRLSNLAGLGQVANGQSAMAAQNYGNNVSANQIGAGNAAAANALNQGNIWGNAINQIGAYGSRKGWFSGGGGGGGGDPGSLSYYGVGDDPMTWGL